MITCTCGHRAKGESAVAARAALLHHAPKCRATSIDFDTATSLVRNLIIETFDESLLMHAWIRGNDRDDAGFEIVFSGGEFGEHSVLASCSSPARILSHWNGYVANNAAMIRRYG